MKTINTIFFLFLSGIMMAQDAAVQAPAANNGFTMDINIILVVLAAFLLYPIGSLARTFVAAAKQKLDQQSKSSTLKVLLPLGLVLLSQIVFAQASSPATPIASNGADSQMMTIVLLCAIGLEMIVMAFLAFRVYDLVQSADVKAVSHSYESSLLHRIKRFVSRQNFRPIEEEGQIDLGHNYDGIRELDNVIPPWFTTAFILTILFAGVYLYRYHIANSAPLQIEEYKMAMAKAEAEHDAYLATQANAIDENSVSIMTGADLDAGKQTFTTICAACHRADGGGQVGPNLTDPYWIHGGSLKDIFKTIKYGVPDKGMISWKEQLSPMQIAQVSNYILTLAGTNPPDPKEQQGTLYTPEPVAADTTSALSTAIDTTTVMK